MRRIKNRNGKKYVQVIEKRRSKYTVLHKVGNTADSNAIDALIKRGELW